MPYKYVSAGVTDDAFGATGRARMKCWMTGFGVARKTIGVRVAVIGAAVVSGSGGIGVADGMGALVGVRVNGGASVIVAKTRVTGVGEGVSVLTSAPTTIGCATIPAMTIAPMQQPTTAPMPSAISNCARVRLLTVTGENYNTGREN